MTTAADAGFVARRDAELAEEASRALAMHLSDAAPVSLCLMSGEGKAETVTVPPKAMRLFVDLLTYMARGDAVMLVPQHAVLTTQEAADLLSISRPHLISLLEGGEIKFHKNGTHRRVIAKDVLEYKCKREQRSQKALDELAAQAQELGLGY